MKVIPLEIYKPHYGDCSNSGLSHKFTEILLEHPDGWIAVNPNHPPENLCKIVTRNIFGREYVHIEPVASPSGAGWMFGGCFAFSSDSRFSELSQYPLALHDRQETWEQYNSNFN